MQSHAACPAVLEEKAGHAWHRVEPASGLNVLAPHTAQAEADAAGVNCPGIHTELAVAPTVVVEEPGGTVRHDVWPDKGLYLPASHGTHAVEALAGCTEPGGHA